MNNCPLNSWQQENKQCTQIVNVQPLKASIDNSQWVCLFFCLIKFSFACFFFFEKINLTLSKLPQLEHNEIYQCIFKDKTMSANTQAIKLDHNRLSCPTPSKNIHVYNGKKDYFDLYMQYND